ncbi:multidrug transporter MatE [Clostridium botulinum]|uniref:Probable multidrug resistance protein NorM n=1 Tax=Clostridium botulinum TaxID=1491 RepID=A0A6B4HSG1_CLOBO|nr:MULTISPECIES: MATE family efflux transporter [Clostridium]ACD53500.1 Na+-driven multidrug efflux pump [Clostridium botulinum E3 str. Alaska E43]AJF29494.1 multidrug transporter MatE [Clostridium botulinum]AJF32555.1 multidrug transporter MatE [Clostridium botulinum]MBY6789362.1 MATE family efflux transporter [Clostridium botulinum]MBY6810131.1 MATE family efflux transporter [Clostridium botulinum]
MTKDMTNGNPTKLILFFSIPLLIGNIFQQLYSMVDTIIVGRFLGIQSLAAVGATGSIFFLIIGFIVGIASGFSVIVSQKFGANDEEGVKNSVATSIMLCIIITIIITTLSLLFSKTMLNLLNTPEDIINSANAYISIIYAGIGATFFYNMISGILRALGDSKTPLYFLIISSILNIILDLVFILNLSMGVAGAAYATVISQAISGILCLIYVYKKFPILRLKKHNWKFDRKFAMEHLNIGLPMALQFSITAIGVMVIQRSLNAFGSTIIAAYTASSKVEQLVMQPAITFGITMATYSGQNLGAGKINRIKEGVKKCCIISTIISVIAGIIVVLFGKSFTKLFIDTPDPNVLAASQHYLNIVSVFFIFLGLLFIYRNTLQGIGDGFVPMMAGVAELLVRVIVAFTLPTIIGYTGICLASPIAWIAACIPLAIKYYKTINKMSINNLDYSKTESTQLLG